MRHLSGGIKSGRYDCQTALPLYISQNVSRVPCPDICFLYFSMIAYPPLSCSCIDKWFDVNRSCPEHPAD